MSLYLVWNFSKKNMGCASSAPLVEQGKHLVETVKDTANDTVAKGEKALQSKSF